MAATLGRMRRTARSCEVPMIFLMTDSIGMAVLCPCLGGGGWLVACVG
jgi:hypothetical protein